MPGTTIGIFCKKKRKKKYERLMWEVLWWSLRLLIEHDSKYPGAEGWGEDYLGSGRGMVLLLIVCLCDSDHPCFTIFFCKLVPSPCICISVN